MIVPRDSRMGIARLGKTRQRKRIRVALNYIQAFNSIHIEFLVSFTLVSQVEIFNYRFLNYK